MDVHLKRERVWASELFGWNSICVTRRRHTNTNMNSVCTTSVFGSASKLATKSFKCDILFSVHKLPDEKYSEMSSVWQMFE